MGIGVTGEEGKGRKGLSCLHHSKHLDWLKFSLNWKLFLNDVLQTNSFECHSECLSLVS